MAKKAFGSFRGFGARPFGTKGRKKAAKPKEPSASRNTHFENKFCEAIKHHLVVTLRCEGDTLDRTFAPHAVFHSTQDKVCVSGTQLRNPEKFGDDDEARYFEIGKVGSMTLTDRKFTPHPWFNRFDDQYRNGIICSV